MDTAPCHSLFAAGSAPRVRLSDGRRGHRDLGPVGPVAQHVHPRQWSVECRAVVDQAQGCVGVGPTPDPGREDRVGGKALHGGTLLEPLVDRPAPTSLIHSPSLSRPSNHPASVVQTLGVQLWFPGAPCTWILLSLSQQPWPGVSWVPRPVLDVGT